MARCSGGANQKGKQRSGRLHLNAGEDNCTKHQSDNFSFMSTISRVAARNQRPQDLQQIAGTGRGTTIGEEDDGTKTERAPSLPSTIPETIARSQSLASTTSQPSITRQRSRSLPYDREDGAVIALGAREHGVAVALDARQANYRTPASFWVAAVFLLTIVAYAYYRWFFRAEFRYQNELLRELYGLQRSGGFWF